MKKIIKILLSILFVVGAIYTINGMVENNFGDRILFVVLAFTFFLMNLFIWIAPKTFFNLCWRITGYLPDNFDYETSFSKLEIIQIGVLVLSIILLLIGVLI